jgi:3',5'-cyclic AMP phosphodiesterase CpdA
MLIAQMSDLHFLPKGVLAFGQVDVAGCLERAVAHLNGLRPLPDLVVITGDLTSDGDEAAHAGLVAHLAALEAPYVPLIGNHDPRELMRQAFDFLACIPSRGRICYVIDDFPIRLVALDSQVDNRPYGTLGPEQLAWLDKRLAERPRKPTLVALHHPPFRTGIGHMDRSRLRDGDELAAVIARHPQVERVLCGHIHRPVTQRFAGTIAEVAPGIAHQTQLVLGEDRGPWICEPPAMLLHYWNGTRIVSHLSLIGTYGPTGRFSAPHQTVSAGAI